jgi:hypothetical protein
LADIIQFKAMKDKTRKALASMKNDGVDWRRDNALCGYVYDIVGVLKQGASILSEVLNEET